MGGLPVSSAWVSSMTSGYVFPRVAEKVHECAFSAVHEEAGLTHFTLLAGSPWFYCVEVDVKLRNPY